MNQQRELLLTIEIDLAILFPLLNANFFWGGRGARISFPLTFETILGESELIAKSGSMPGKEFDWLPNGN